jgi:class 3 adenylate cyclase/tetratricopeptide (TPR) repeat protein
MNCGASLGAAQGGNSSKSKFLDQYLPQELIVKLQAARSGNSLAGERRIITMLFCDVKGSTAAAETMDPEDWTVIINGAFERMIAPIYKYEGLVPRLMGDAILAFFGAPIAHEDDPQRAILAGLEIQSGIKAYADEMRLKHKIEFGLRVGINTGLVVVGEIGSDLRMEYTAIGDAINLAARMEQTAQPGTVQITEDTYKLVAPLFDVESLGGIEVKGKAAPVKAYRVISAREIPGHLRGLEGLSSPLVGRQAQLSLIEDSLNRLLDGSGGFAAIVGEAGLGKSTLVAEAQKLEAASLVNWFRGDALSYARSTSYFIWRQVLRQSLNAHEGDPPAEVRSKLQARCQACSLPVEDRSFLEAILAVESPESLETLAGFQGDDFVRHMTAAARAYLNGLLLERPLVVIFDDLHWADEASLALLINLSDMVEQGRLLFICMTRPDNHAAFIAPVRDKLHEKFSQIDLEPLQDDQANLLLTNILGAEGLPASLREQILKKAEGNPYFVEEMIRSLIETNQIVRDDGHWRIANKDVSLALPGTLNGVLSARIDRLPEASKQLLQMASVIGRSFDLRLLRGLSNSNGGLDDHIRIWHRSGLIQPLEPEQYIFRHVLIQEAAYQSTLLKRRRELHLRIGEILEGFHAERLEEFAPLLAFHFYNAGDARSLKYDLIAGDKAAHLFANAEAAIHYSRALETARRTGADSQLFSKLYGQLGGVLELSGRYDQALANYEEMGAFAREHNDPSIELNALMAKATLYSTYTPLHNSELSEKTLLQALELSHKVGDRLIEARLHWSLMLTYVFSSRISQATEHGELALELARGSGDREQLAFVLNDLGHLHTNKGEFEQAYAVLREARELWRALDNQAMLADSLGTEASAHYNAGDYDGSLELSKQALQMSEKMENLWGKAYNRMLMSFAYFDRGDIGLGIRLSSDAVPLGDQAGLLATSIATRSDLAWMLGYYGAIQKGLDILDVALDYVEKKQPDWKDLPIAVKVRLHLLQGDLPAAERVAGHTPLQPVSIPYARYTILVCLANVELAMAHGDNRLALALVEELLSKVISLTRPEVPEAIRIKGDILINLGRFDEAYNTLNEARTMADGIHSEHELWSILSSLAVVNTKHGRINEAKKLRIEALALVEKLAGKLDDLGMRDTFLSQPRVKILLS